MVAAFVRSILLLLFLAMTTSCVVVHAHEREHLAKRSMTKDSDAGEESFKDGVEMAWRESRPGGGE